MTTATTWKHARRWRSRRSMPGLAFTKAYVGYVHAFSHKLGGMYGVPHGLANAITLPYVLDFIKDAPLARERLAKLAVVIGAGTAGEPREMRWRSASSIACGNSIAASAFPRKSLRSSRPTCRRLRAPRWSRRRAITRCRRTCRSARPRRCCNACGCDRASPRCCGSIGEGTAAEDGEQAPEFGFDQGDTP